MLLLNIQQTEHKSLKDYGPQPGNNSTSQCHPPSQLQYNGQEVKGFGNMPSTDLNFCSVRNVFKQHAKSSTDDNESMLTFDDFVITAIGVLKVINNQCCWVTAQFHLMSYLTVTVTLL